MPDILTPTGMKLRSDDVRSALFFEAGADLGRGFLGGPQDKAEDDTLTLQMKDPETKYDDIKGPHARRIAEALEQAGVNVSRRHKR